MTNATDKHTPGPWRADSRMINTLTDTFVVVVDQFGKYVARSLIAGRQHADARLIAAAPDLLALARQYASECATCGGTGLVTIYDYDGNGSDADDQLCHDCADIRAVIARATNSEPTP